MSAPAPVEETPEVLTDAPSPAEAKRRANGYYYWHGHGKDRAAAGDVAPMPTPVLVKKDDAAGEAVRALVQTPVVATVKKYGWSDGKKFVTVYVAITDPAASAAAAAAAGEGEAILDEKSVRVDYTTVSFAVRFDVTSAAGASDTAPPTRRARQLCLHLSKRIDPARCEVRVRVEKKEIQLRLAKASEETWFDLVGTAKEEEEEEDGSDENGEAEDS